MVVDAGADVEQNPRADELHGRLCQVEGELGDEDDHHETEVVVTDTVIDDSLGEEGEDELEQRAEQHPEKELHDEFLVGFEILQHEAEFGLVLLLVLRAIEIRGRFQQQGHALVLSFRLSAEPPRQEFLYGEFDFPLSRVRHEDGTDILVSFLLRPYVVHHHKMVLSPVYDAGQGCLTQLLKRYMHADGAEADAFGCGADTKHTHALASDEAFLPERLQRVVLAIMLSYHPQAGGAAIHGIELVIIGERMGHISDR